MLMPERLNFLHMKIGLICLLAIVCPVSYAVSQPMKRAVPLSIGDTLPDIVLHDLYNYPASNVPISSFKSDLVLLDFWATWCSSCIASFPKMHALQARFGHSISIIMVNGSLSDQPKKVSAFFARRKSRSGDTFTLPYMLGDTVVQKYFPFFYLPHYVWLNKDRRVIAITASEDVTESNIGAAIKGQAVSFRLKNDDLRFQPEKMLLGDQGVPAFSQYVFRSALTKGNPSLSYESGTESNDSGLVSRYFDMNKTAISLFRSAYPAIVKYGSDRTFFRDSSLHMFSLDELSPALYCYDLYTSPLPAAQVMQYVQQDISRAFNAVPVNAQRMLDCFVLQVQDSNKVQYNHPGNSKTDYARSTLKKILRNSTPAELASLCGTVLQQNIYDETGILKTLDMDIPYNIYEYSFSELNAFLETQGFIIQKEKRKMDVTIFIDNTFTNPKNQ